MESPSLATREFVFESLGKKAYVEVSSEDTLAKVRKLILEELDSHQFPSGDDTDFGFEVNGIGISTKQETKKNAFALLDKGAKVELIPRSIKRKISPQAADSSPNSESNNERGGNSEAIKRRNLNVSTSITPTVHTLQMEETRLPSDNHCHLGQPPTLKKKFSADKHNGNRLPEATKNLSPFQRAAQLEEHTTAAHGSRVSNVEDYSTSPPVPDFQQAGINASRSLYSSLWNGSKRPSQQNPTPPTQLKPCTGQRTAECTGRNTAKVKTNVTMAPESNNGIVHPHEHDVLSGRGNFVNWHAGNEHFRALVRKHKVDYVKCQKRILKNKLAKMIVDEIKSRNPPGRFLDQDPATKLWYDIGGKKALEKARQALRQGAPELMKVMSGTICNASVAGLASPAFSAGGFQSPVMNMWNPLNISLGNLLSAPQLLSPGMMKSPKKPPQANKGKSPRR